MRLSSVCLQLLYDTIDAIALGIGESNCAESCASWLSWSIRLSSVCFQLLYDTIDANISGDWRVKLCRIMCFMAELVHEAEQRMLSIAL